MVSISRAVGEVGSHLVTSREVRINEAVAYVLSAQANQPIAIGAFKKQRLIALSDPAFPSQVLKVLDEWTVFLEAGAIGEVGRDTASNGVEVSRLAKLAMEGWKGNSDWELLAPTLVEVRGIIERKLAAQALERLKSDTALVHITDAEALQYYKKNRLRFGNMPFENFKDNIKAALAKGQTERRLFEWRSVLRRKYRVRNFLGA
jgi:hypothetical protein